MIKVYKLPSQMRRYYCLFVLIFAGCIHAYGQKLPIDTSILGKWDGKTAFPDMGLSDNGKYYFVGRIDKNALDYQLTAGAVEGPWKTGIHCPQAVHVQFAGNKLVFQMGDSLGMIEAGKIIKYVPHVKSFTVEDHWLAMLLNDAGKTLVLKNIVTAKERRFNEVEAFQFSADGNSLVLQKASANKSHPVSIALLNTNTGYEHLVWEGDAVEKLVFDPSDTCVAFFERQGTESDPHYSIYLYSPGMDKAKKVIDDSSSPLGKGCIINNEMLAFSNNGSQLLFQYYRIIPVSTNKIKLFSGVNIWNYKDKYLPTEGGYKTDPDPAKFYAVAHIASGNVTKLNDENEQLVLPWPISFEDHFLLLRNLGLPDAYKEKRARPDLLLISTKNGHKDTLLKNELPQEYTLSPDQKFAVWFEKDSLRWKSYEIQTGITRNISDNVSAKLYDEEEAKSGRISKPFQIAEWEIAKNQVWLYDKYDIWAVDLMGNKLAINMTNGYGSKNQVVFSYISFKLKSSDVADPGNYLLAGFNRANKANGFWKFQPNQSGDPVMLCMDPCAYFIPRTGLTSTFEESARGAAPIKAKDADVYIVRKETASDFPNYYITSDFKTWKQITNVHPEKAVNWLKTELVTWNMTDGQPSKGILYKPENFDPHKKYPVIFTYYEKRSDQLNKFITPDWTSARIDIPYYVSNGYLVFVPDIYYKQGHNGQGVINSVVSAAKYLSKFPFVDSTKLGIQGHSFGGWETNFLVTHTQNLFAAACEASGVSDQISRYHQLDYDGESRQSFYETDSQGSAYGVGVTPSTNRELYIENSPVLYANNATTPLLIMHGDRDQAVPFIQGVEMFTALKRAGKKVWLLEYPTEGHGLSGENTKDYTIRMKQFFDHYLKGAPPPKWMTEESNKVSTTVSPYDLDTSGKQP